MDYTTYQQRVLARASHRWHHEKLDMRTLENILKNFIEWGNMLDAVKKSLMYGRQFGIGIVDEACSVPNEKDQRLIHAMLGVATEGVEMMEAVQDYFFAGKPFDQVNLQEEFGDTEWYRAFGLSELNQTHEENIAQNDAKLEARYGGTFSEERANERNLDQERKILKG